MQCYAIALYAVMRCPSVRPSVCLSRSWILSNKCIGDDTKAAARQSLNYIKNKKNIWRKTIFNYARWNSYTLQCGMWLWNHDSEFTKWQHPAMWYVALGWYAIEFAQTSAILEFYIWLPPAHITAVDMSFCIPVCEILSKSDHPRQKKWRHVDFQDGASQPSWIVGIQ